MARIKTVLRRSKGAATEEIRISGLTVRMKEGKVLKNGQEVILTALEYKLLLTFLQNRGRVLSAICCWRAFGMWPATLSATTR